MAVDPAVAREQIQSLAAKLKEEQERIRRELSEIDVLIRQTQVEVEKLAQRELSVANRLRDLEVNLERYDRPTIKSFYTSAHEVRMRLQMMRSQLDQLQTKQQNLRDRQEQTQHYRDVIEQALGAIGGVEGIPATVAETDPNEMIAQIIQAQEKERLRISLQMHDGPAQSMSNLVLRAEICERFMERDINAAKAELGSLKSAINTTLQDTRRFIFDLRPMILDDLGLIPTLRRYIQEFGEKHKLEINLMVQGLDTRLPNHYEVTIFRFIQEALNNVAKHANASHVRVYVEQLDGQLQLAVEDDGSGFQVSEILADGPGHRNMGIASMRQQIEVLLRGQFGIESTLGRGTRIAALIPIHQS
ncbi:MAG: histidine kinase [Herpetosiphonaceae bacterium]|nr:MAG: histidine kinase [Herpetosiphonaceae bacterium]